MFYAGTVGPPRREKRGDLAFCDDKYFKEKVVVLRSFSLVKYFECQDPFPSPAPPLCVETDRQGNLPITWRIYGEVFHHHSPPHHSVHERNNTHNLSNLRWWPSIGLAGGVSLHNLDTLEIFGGTLEVVLEGQLCKALLGDCVRVVVVHLR